MLAWVEAQVAERKERGVQIRNPLAYRLSVLLNGIILLQESKFICDAVENALRQSFIEHSALHQLTWNDVRVAEWKRVCRKFQAKQKVIDKTKSIDPDFVMCFTFYQLTQTIVYNWKTASGRVAPGYRNLFKGVAECGDVNRFEQDMKTLRMARNSIAHSEKLFTPEQTRQLYRKACFWLDPLEVKLSSRVLEYRSKRPRFMNDLHID